MVLARSKEVVYAHARKMYRYSTRAECRQVTGGAPIRVRWVDSIKRDEVRARLVAIEVRRKWEAGTFPGTPPLESRRVLAHLVAQTIQAILNLGVC